MILKELFGKLAADSALAALLGATPGDPRIYPGMARPGCAAPFIVYRSLCPGAQADEISRAETVVFEIFSERFSNCLDISRRMAALLTTADETSLSGAGGPRIYRGALAGGSDFSDERNRHVRALTFHFSFIDSTL
ncbi:MAG: hypothetical protein PHW69_02630 [Elusimicrobiaceae bacterium]|nr:hypothetical protein [Elusimicrobiaceae bacterium]